MAEPKRVGLMVLILFLILMLRLCMFGTEGGQLKLIAILPFFFLARNLTRETDWRENRSVRPVFRALATSRFHQAPVTGHSHRYRPSKPRLKAASPFIFTAIQGISSFRRN